MSNLKNILTKSTCIENIRINIFDIKPSDATNIAQMPPEDIVVLPITSKDPFLTNSIDTNIKNYLTNLHYFGLLLIMVEHAIKTLRIMSNHHMKNFDSIITQDIMHIYNFFGQSSLIKDQKTTEANGRTLLSSILREGQYLNEYINKYKKIFQTQFQKHVIGGKYSKSRYLSRKNNKSQISHKKKKTKCKKQLKYGGNPTEKKITDALQILFRRKFIFSAITIKKEYLSHCNLLTEVIDDIDLQLWLKIDPITKERNMVKDIRLFADITQTLMAYTEIYNIISDKVLLNHIQHFFYSIRNCENTPYVKKLLKKKRTWLTKAMMGVGIVATLAGVLYAGTKIMKGDEISVASVKNDISTLKTSVADKAEDLKIDVGDKLNHVTTHLDIKMDRLRKRFNNNLSDQERAEIDQEKEEKKLIKQEKYVDAVEERLRRAQKEAEKAKNDLNLQHEVYDTARNRVQTHREKNKQDNTENSITP